MTEERGGKGGRNMDSDITEEKKQRSEKEGKDDKKRAEDGIIHHLTLLRKENNLQVNINQQCIHSFTMQEHLKRGHYGLLLHQCS